MIDPIEDIKSRLDIADIVREYIKLQPSGAYLKAPCPFHQEKSPSFMVNTNKQIWHCFGCNLGGDMFSFVMKQEGVGFPEALRILAEKAGVTLARHDPKAASEKNSLLDVITAAADFFHQALLKAPQAEIARDYIKKRGLSPSIVDEFKIGFSLPDSSRLSQYLLDKKYSAKDILDAGLAIQKEQGYGLIDRFRGRLMIPINNVHGQIVGFGGRILDDAANVAKYMNSPQTQLYDKSRVVFGLDRAKQDIRKEDAVILVEGYMDHLASYQAGIKNIVATSGTALTSEQIKLIKRFTQQFFFSFDTDAAGSQATMRGVELALKEGVNAKVVMLPKNEDGTMKYKDPDECINKNPDEWRSSITGAVPFIDYCIQKVQEKGEMDGFAKKNAIQGILNSIALIPDPIEKDHWIGKVAETFNSSKEILWSELRKKEQVARQEGVATVARTTKPTPIVPEKHLREHYLLALLAARPKLFEVIKPYIKPEAWRQELSKGLYEYLENRYSNTEEPEKLAHFEDYIGKLELFASKEIGELDEKSAVHLAQTIAQQVKNDYIHRRTEELRVLIAEAEGAGDQEASRRYAEEFFKIYQ